MSSQPANPEAADRAAQAPAAGVFAHWPNRITAIRFVGALILFGVLGFVEQAQPSADTARRMFTLATVLFVAVAATDWLDGWLARRHGHVTAFGRIADPFVDKILILGTFVFLAVLEPTSRFVPGWLVVMVLARELLVTGIRGYVESLGRSFAADRWGKIKMIVQCIAIGVVLSLEGIAWPGGLHDAMIWVAYISVALTLISSLQSGFSYAFKCRAILAEDPGSGGLSS